MKSFGVITVLVVLSIVASFTGHMTDAAVYLSAAGICQAIYDLERKP